MKKFILMLALFSAVLGANAQIATQNSKLFDNVGVGVTVGASTPLDFNSMFPLNMNAGLKIVKEVTPVLGLQVEGLAIFNDNHFSNLKTMVKATNVGLNGTINLSNALFGYNGTPRTFEVAAVGGIGWLHAWNTKENSLTAKTGLDLMLNFGKTKAHSLVLTPAVFWNLHKVEAIQFTKKGAQLALNLTYLYHFKTSNGTRHFKTYDVGAMLDEINRLNTELAEANSRKPQTVVVEKIVEVEKPISSDKTPTNAVVDNAKWTVPFNTSSANLNVEGHFILNQIPENIVVDITATASPSGSKEFNQKLSEARAKAVADYLTNRGVKVNSAVGKGVDKTSGRTAVVVPAQ